MRQFRSHAVFVLQEVHILNKFDKDFYDERLTIFVIRYIRPERDFESVGK